LWQKKHYLNKITVGKKVNPVLSQLETEEESVFGKHNLCLEALPAYKKKPLNSKARNKIPV
jgi:hypothetical protein